MDVTEIQQHLVKSGKFSDADLKQLNQIETGDKNNKKGHSYEKWFTLYQFLSYKMSAKIPLSDILICNNIPAYVDDLTIEYVDNHQKYKNNYQLKNSPNTGRWNKDLENKFHLQKKYDEVLHFNKKNQSYLICSDNETIQFNQKCHSEHCVSQFYPYYETVLDMLNDEETGLKRLLTQICPDLTQHTTAVSLLLMPMNGNEQLSLSVEQWWEEVKSAAKPNIFKDTSWDFCNEFTMCCQKHHLMIQPDTLFFQGWSCNITDDLVYKINSLHDFWQSIDSKETLIFKLLELSALNGQ